MLIDVVSINQNLIHKSCYSTQETIFEPEIDGTFKTSEIALKKFFHYYTLSKMQG
jgi:hypothetical protein